MGFTQRRPDSVDLQVIQRPRETRIQSTPPIDFVPVRWVPWAHRGFTVTVCAGSNGHGDGVVGPCGTVV